MYLKYGLAQNNYTPVKLLVSACQPGTKRHTRQVYRVDKHSLSASADSQGDKVSINNKRKTFTTVKKDLECSHTFEHNVFIWIVWLDWIAYLIDFRTTKTGNAV
jgi:hypothetical protein